MAVTRGMASLRAACRLVPGVPVPEPATAIANPGSTTWVPAARLGEPTVVATAFDALRAVGGSRNAAAMAFLQGVAYAVVGPTVAGSLGPGVVPPPQPAGAWFGFRAGGFCDRVAYEALDVVPAEPGEFEDRVAESALEVLTPVVDHLHRSSGLGGRVLWSTVPDSIMAIGLAWTARSAGSPRALPAATRHAWSRSTALIDALAQRVPSMSARPRRLRVTGPGGAVTWMVRGGCCFVYRDTAQYCLACPVMDDDARGELLMGWLLGSDG